MLAAGSATRVSTRGPLEPPLLLRATPATARLPAGAARGRSFVTLPKLRCTKPAELLVLQRLRACAFGSGPRRCASCCGFAIRPRSGGRDRGGACGSPRFAGAEASAERSARRDVAQRPGSQVVAGSPRRG